MVFETFQSPAAFITDPAPLALYATGRTTGLVVDAGHCRTAVVPVYEGFPLKHAAQDFPISGRDIGQYLGSLLADSNPGVTMQKHIDTEMTMVKLKETMCSVASLRDPRLWQDPGEQEEYTLPDGARIKCGKERYLATEPMFAPFVGLPSACLRTLSLSDVTFRGTLAQNVVLVSGALGYFCSRNNRLPDGG
jgi:centractin